MMVVFVVFTQELSCGQIGGMFARGANFGSNHEFWDREYRLPIGFLKKQSVKSEVPEMPAGADTVTPTVHHVFEDICYDMR